MASVSLAFVVRIEHSGSRLSKSGLIAGELLRDGTTGLKAALACRQSHSLSDMLDAG